MFATMPVYYPTYRYAQQHGEEELWRESHRVNLECKGQINRRALETANSRELDLMVDDLIRVYGIERTMCVLSRTVQYRDWEESLSKAVQERASAFSFDGQEDEDGNDLTALYVCHALRPRVLLHLYNRLMEREQQQPVMSDPPLEQAPERGL